MTGGAPDLGEAADDAAAWGFSSELVDRLRDVEPEGFAVWPENWPVIKAWLEIAGQWRATAMADGRVYFHALDYAAAQAGFGLAGLTVPPATWAGVRVMEAEARKALNGS